MRTADVGIIGYGMVGQADARLFTSTGKMTVALYDIKHIHNPPAMTKVVRKIDDLKNCPLIFVAVPTPTSTDGDGSCETGIVSSVCSNLSLSYMHYAGVVVLQSTVPPATTSILAANYGLRLVFHPEYFGETPDHPFQKMQDRRWITLGGTDEDCDVVEAFYAKIFNPTLKVFRCTSTEAELAKYMENCSIGTQVVFHTMFAKAAEKLGCSYSRVREAFHQDPRFSRYFTRYHSEHPGYGGCCIPKDTAAFVAWGKDIGLDVGQLEATIAQNGRVHGGKINTNHGA